MSNTICSPFKNVLTFLSPFFKYANKENDISHAFASTNQEIFFDQSQYISVVFLVFSLVFSCCVSVFLGILLYLILSAVSVLYRNYHSITKKSRAISCHSLFPAWECKQTWLFLNFVPTIDFTSSQFPAYKKRQLSEHLFLWTPWTAASLQLIF